MVALGCYLKPTFYAILLIVKNKALPKSAVPVGGFSGLQFGHTKEHGL